MTRPHLVGFSLNHRQPRQSDGQLEEQPAMGGKISPGFTTAGYSQGRRLIVPIFVPAWARSVR